MTGDGQLQNLVIYIVQPLAVMATITEYEEFVKDLQSDNKPSLDKLSRFLRVVRDMNII